MATKKYLDKNGLSYFWDKIDAKKQDKLTAGSNITFSGSTINATVPTKTSDLTNDGSDGTSTYVEADQLATVATSGSYNDLSNKPTIPTVNNATLTIQKNGTTVNTFTANASSNVTANITVPTLYTTTGQNTDGAVTQKLFTDTVGNVETILQTLNNGGGAQ